MNNSTLTSQACIWFPLKKKKYVKQMVYSNCKGHQSTSCYAANY